MLSLSGKQLAALHAMIHGPSILIDDETMSQLRWAGLANVHNLPTTAAWHDIGEFRYLPQIKIPLEWEIDTWQGHQFRVEELRRCEPGQGFGVETMTSYSYIFDAYEIMRYYREIRLAQHRRINEKWTKQFDLDYHDNYIKVGNDHHRRLADQLVLISERLALDEVSHEWGMNHTSDLFFKWAHNMYQSLELTSKHSISVNYKFGLAANIHEHEQLLMRGPINENGQIHALVFID